MEAQVCLEKNNLNNYGLLKMDGCIKQLICAYRVCHIILRSDLKLGLLVQLVKLLSISKCLEFEYTM